MALSYRKLTAEEDLMRNVLPDGDYPFSIEEIIEKKTKGGLDKDGKEKVINPMLELHLSVLDINGREKKMRDWVILDGEMAHRFRHLCESTGLLEKYDNLTVTARDLLGKNGVAKLKSKEFIDNNGETRKGNYVVDYVKPGSYINKPAEVNFNIDDDIPQ